jgi:glycosyltransferase involved in cell wall biosynthesis
MSGSPLLLASHPPYPSADGVSAPRLDFVELARAIGGAICFPIRDGSIARLEERIAVDGQQALAAVRRRGVSVYVSLSERIGIPLAFLLGRRRVRHVLVAHHLTSKKKRALQRRTGYLHRFDRIVVLCRKQEEYLRAEVGLPAERLHFVYDKVDTEFWKASHPAPLFEDRFVLSVGRERRDYVTLLTAARRMPDLRFVLVLSSPWSRQGDRPVADMPPNVVILRDLTWCDLRALYERAAVVVVPLLPGIDYAAGVNAALEAMAMGRPLVVTATPGIAEYVAEGENALIVPPADPDALVRAVEGIFTRPGLATQRTASARQAVEAHNRIEGYVALLARILREVNER